MPSLVRRILAPTDFSAASDAALDYARTLAERFGAHVHLLHVLEEPFVGGGVASDALVTEAPAVRAALLRAAQERLAHRVTQRDREQLHMTAEVVFGTAAQAILDNVRRNGDDLIVMGTHGRTGMAHVVLGSVAEHVVRAAPCPVLTVRYEPDTVHVGVHAAAGR